MPVSIHSASVGVMSRMLGNLSALLDAAVTHAEANHVDPATLLEARLAPDMFALVRQVQMASDTAKFAGARLAGVEAPGFADIETTFPELQERISRTIRYLEGLDPALVETGESRIVTIKQGGRSVGLRGPDYLRQYALPNFFFHVSTAYALLRANGVPLGKLDYLGVLAADEAGAPLAERSVRYG